MPPPLSSSKTAPAFQTNTPSSRDRTPIGQSSQEMLVLGSVHTGSTFSSKCECTNSDDVCSCRNPPQRGDSEGRKAHQRQCCSQVRISSPLLALPLPQDLQSPALHMSSSCMHPPFNHSIAKGRCEMSNVPACELVFGHLIVQCMCLTTHA